MFKRFASIFMAATLLLTFAQPVFAHYPSANGASCNGTLVGVARLYGDENQTPASHHLYSCGLNGFSSDLRNVSIGGDNQWMICNGPFLEAQNFGNCLSSISVDVRNFDYRFCLYYNAGYSGPTLNVVGDWTGNLAGTVVGSDKALSMRWRSDAQGC